MRKIQRRDFLKAMGLATAALGLTACGGSKDSDTSDSSGSEGGKTYTLRFAHASSTSEPINAAAEYMKKELEERSNGAITLEIYPSATLADQTASCRKNT